MEKAIIIAIVTILIVVLTGFVQIPKKRKNFEINR